MLGVEILGQLFSFIGGLGLFIYGMHVMSVGLQKAAGNKMKELLAVLTKNKFFGVLVGALVTGVIQSSSATTVMVVGFVNAGIMNLSQTVGIIMGANIGTTVTAWLMASVEWAGVFNPVFLAPLAVGIGSFALLFARKEKTRHIGEIVIGFGILFLGMSIMSDTLKIYKDSQFFKDIFITLGTNPFLGLLAGCAVTAVIQSSSASVAILQSVAFTGYVPWGAAVYIIMGQNIGTCITAILSSIGANRNAKAASYIHLLFNVIGSLVFTLVAIIYFSFFNRVLASSYISATWISVVHTAFNVLTVILLYNFSNALIVAAKKIAWGKTKETDELTLVHLDERILDTPYFALQNAVKEIARLAELTLLSLKEATETLLDADETKVANVLNREKDIDELTRLISQYLVRLSNREHTKQEGTTITSLINTINNLERVGDHCENIAELTQFCISENIALSDIATNELAEIINATVICYETAVRAFEQGDYAMAAQVAAQEDIIDSLEKRYREEHIDRLKAGSCGPAGGVFFLDTMTNLERIGDHALNISEYVMDEYEEHHRHKKVV